MIFSSDTETVEIYIYIYIYIYICISLRFMVLTSSLGKRMEDEILQYY